jgi:hypothetical protein
MKIYESKVATIELHSVQRALQVKWTAFHDSAQLRQTIDAGLELVKKHGARTWIADTSNVKGAMRKDDQEWIGQSAPRFLPYLDAILTIPPTSALADLSNKGWQATIPDNGVIVSDVPNIQAALDVAAKVLTRKAA